MKLDKGLQEASAGFRELQGQEASRGRRLQGQGTSLNPVLVLNINRW